MITAEHQAAIRAETLISIAINALVPTAIIWAVGLPPPAALGGDEGLLGAMAKGSGLATLAMTAIVTLLVRGRVAKGKVPALALADVPAPVRWLPRLVGLRAVVMALVAVALLVPIGAAVAAVLAILPLSVTGFAVFNLIFGAVVGVTMTPPVVLRALADPVP